MNHKMTDVEKLSHLFKNYYAMAPEEVLALAQAGSSRRYYRLRAGDTSCVGVVGDNVGDCRAFIDLSSVFAAEGINVPKVHAVSDDSLCYLQDDLGDVSLFDLIKKGEDVTELVKKSLAMLVKMQKVDKEKWKDCTAYPAFSDRQTLWDLNYFKYEYLLPSGVTFNENKLEDDFDRMVSRLLEASCLTDGFMYRDFQSRNVMIKDGEPWFIDFQGGRWGPGLYDAVSFLWQAKAGFSRDFRERMLHFYGEEFARDFLFSADILLEDSARFVLFRTLQVLGAYGLRGLVEKKAHFIESIPGALKNLEELLDEGRIGSYPELERVARKIIDDPRFSKDAPDGRLKVKVFSFSFKKGYPADYSGNGGGFMFDCRGMHNPGRYDEYKALTGMDEPVIAFLKEKGEADGFADRAVEIVAPTVDRYIKRGFDSLQVGFGCTGGRHRSVYCAERFAAEIAGRFPEAEVILTHREQGMEKRIEGK